MKIFIPLRLSVLQARYMTIIAASIANFTSYIGDLVLVKIPALSFFFFFVLFHLLKQFIYEAK